MALQLASSAARRAANLARVITAIPAGKRAAPLALLSARVAAAPEAVRPASTVATAPIEASGSRLFGRALASQGAGSDVASLIVEEDDETLRLCNHGTAGPPKRGRSVGASGSSLGARLAGSVRGLATAAAAAPRRRAAASAPPQVAEAEESGSEGRRASEIDVESEEEEAAAGGVAAAADKPLGVDLEEVAGLTPAMRDRLRGAGIARLFPVQQRTLETALARQDIVVRSRTGSGKTLGFVIPIVQSVEAAVAAGGRDARRTPRCLVLVPTRELAKQVEDEFQRVAAGGRLRTAAIYGGAPSGPQEGALRRGVDIVVGTPGECERCRCVAVPAGARVCQGSCRLLP